MKKSFVVFAMLLVATFVFAQKAGDKIEFDTKDMGGNSVTSAIFADSKLTMINIWGTFCGPCIREMPDLGKLNEANKSRGMQIIGIPIDIVDWNGREQPRTKANGEAIIKRTGANYMHLVPTKEMLNGFLRNVQAVPMTFFVDSTGKIVGDVYMGSRSQKDWQKIIDSLLK